MRPISLYQQEGNRLICLPVFLRYGLLLTVILILSLPTLPAQDFFEETAPGKYRIEFTDKDNNPFTLENPGEFLSPKALGRRSKQNIPVALSDVPVTPAYLDSVRAAGASILTLSKWFNAVTIYVGHDSVIGKLAKLTFVKKNLQNKRLINPAGISTRSSGIQENQEAVVFDYGPSWWQSAVHNGHLLHGRGYTGKDITIAVIDAGFYHINEIQAFDHLWENGQILGTRDFVDPGADVFSSHTHGMIVLSVMGGYLPGELIGTATGAGYWLLRSEDGNSEYVIEEDNWVAAAEFADSAGADIISSSLGYTQFDDPLQNHTYADMDGNTTRVSRAADLAASKGMLVVISAGNQGSTAWKYISAPADADSVIAAGAIDGNLYVADFSSRGPSSDDNVKPDVMAIGMGTYVAGNESGIQQANGTSLSAPVIAGLSACLWQANRNASAMDLVQAVRQSGDHYTRPNEDVGYGIPDFNLAHVLLKVSSGDADQFGEKITFFPNPFHDQLFIIFKDPVDVPVEISLFDLIGKQLCRYGFAPFPDRSFLNMKGMFNHLPDGVYLIKVNAGPQNGIFKVIKH